jgi:hypothetical protein
MKKSILFVVGLSLFSTNRSEARLGESIEQIKVRYGQDIEIVNPQVSNTAVVFQRFTDALWQLEKFGVTIPKTDTANEWQLEKVSFKKYQFGKFSVYVIFINSIAVFEHFYSPNEKAVSEKAKLMEVNSDKSKWIELTNTSYNELDDATAKELALRQGPKPDGEAWQTIDPVSKKPIRFFTASDDNQFSFIDQKLIDFCFSENKRLTDKEAKIRSQTLEGL